MKQFKKLTLLLFLVAAIVLVFNECKKKDDETSDVLYAKISGIITDSETDEPIKGSEVKLSPSGASKITGDDGRYQFEDLDAGEYTVQVSKEGYETNSRDFKLEAGQTTTGDIALTPLQPELTITPTTDMDFGENTINKTLSISNTGTGVLSYNISVVPASTWLIATPATGEVNASQTEAITVIVDRSNESPGIYNATLLINSNGGDAVQINVQMQVAEQNEAPTASFDVTPTSGTLSQIFEFDASASSDPEGSELQYNWNYGDGNGYHGFGTNVTRTFQYSESGAKTVKLIVRDAQGAVDSTTRTLTVLANNPPEIVVSSCPSTVAINETFTLDVSATTDDNDELDDIQFAYQWEDGAGYSAYTYNYVVTHAYSVAGTKTISIKAMDSHGDESEPFTRNIVVEEPTLATVTTGSESYVTHNAAYYSGNITDLGTGVTQVDEHGHCWSVSANPTISDEHSTLGATSNTGSFTSQLTGLNPTTTYHVRAYVTNAAGTSYGADKTFTTNMPYPPGGVITGAITNIYQNTATAAGTIANLGVGTTVIQHGHCWSTSTNPTTSDYKTEHGSYSGSTPYNYDSDLTNLTAGQTYHVRAYITTNQGTVYGNDVTFTTSTK